MKSGDDILLIQAALDGELDAAGMLQVEARLAACEELAAEYAALQALQRLMRRELGKPAAPPALRQRIVAMAASPVAEPLARAAPQWRALAASAVLAAGLAASATYLAIAPHNQGAKLAEAGLTDALLANHKRGLLSGQPVDVASSDRHMVKPWFATHFALAPRVADLAAKGFPLVGGRIDVIAGQPAATLVYRHNEHLISLTSLPAREPAPEAAQSLDGYQILGWREGAFDYWAVSDIDPSELARFRQAFSAAATGGEQRP